MHGLPTVGHSPSRTSRTILLIAVSTLTALVVVGIAALHVGERRDQRNAAWEKLALVANSAAGQFKAGQLQALLARFDGRDMVITHTQDARYYLLHDQLQHGRQQLGNDALLHVLVYDNLKSELQLVVTTDDRPRFRHRAELGAGSVQRAYGTPGRSTDALAGTTYLLAFEPIMDDAGRVAGMLVAGIPEELVLAQATPVLVRNASIALVLLIVGAVFLFRTAGRRLQHQEHQHQALRAQHADVTDSLAYAGKIQRALVPHPELYAVHFKDAFVIDRPRDAVGGDFHWLHQVNEDVTLVAAADCTGHGLPGAMLGAIACSLLNEIATSAPTHDPAHMLALLNTRLVHTLHQQGQRRGAGDGLDIALCRVDRKEHEILFAGARRPLYWLHGGQLSVINGDRLSVGGAHQQADRRFATHRLAYAPGDRIYLFSDGYVDQLGGPEGRRFMASRLQDLIHQHSHLDMATQGRLLDKAFLDWRGEGDQVDDICLLGLAV